jgi:hypothetical protein
VPRLVGAPGSDQQRRDAAVRMVRGTCRPIMDEMRERGFESQAARLAEILEQLETTQSLDDVVGVITDWRNQLQAFFLNADELECPKPNSDAAQGVVQGVKLRRSSNGLRGGPDACARRACDHPQC